MELPGNPVEDSLIDELFNNFMEEQEYYDENPVEDHSVDSFMEEQQFYSSTHFQIRAFKDINVENSPTNQEPTIDQTVRVNRFINDNVEIDQDEVITANPTDDEIVNNIFDNGMIDSNA